MKRLLALLLAALLATLLPAAPALAGEALTLGVFAFRPKPWMQEHYQPLADYLGAELKDTPVRLLVLEQGELAATMASRRLDFLMTNPSHLVELHHQMRLSGPLATVHSLEDGQATAQLGGVILAAAGRNDLRGLDDLRRRRLAVPGTQHLGGYQAQALELLEAGIRLPRDAELLVTGGHDKVVEAVLDGQADAGFVRTGILERMAAEGKLDLAKLKILNPRREPGFPYRLSTRLYPEWPFLALPHVETRTVQRVAAALYSLDATHPAAQAASLAGFVPPLDYMPVEQLARILRLPPYDREAPISPAEIWRDYWPVLLTGLAGLALAMVLLVLLARRNRELAHSEARFRQLYQQAPLAYQSLDAEGNILDVNEAWLAQLGYGREEVIGKHIRAFLSEPSLATLEAEFPRLLLTDQVDGPIYALRRKDGSLRQMQVSGRVARDAQGRFVRTHCILADVTERLAAEQALCRESEKNRALLRNASDGIHILDRQGNLIEASESFFAMLGYTRDELIGSSVARWDAGFSSVELGRVLDRQFEQPVRSQFETRHRRKDGSIIDVEVSGYPLELDGVPVLFNSSRDISDTLRTRQQLQRRERYQRALLDNFPFLVWLKDAQSRFLAVNRPFAAACGRTSVEEFPGRTDLDVWPHDLAEGYRADDRAVLASGQPKSVEELIEHDGRRRWYETYKSPVSIDGEVIGTVGFARDITDRRDSETLLDIQHRFTGLLVSDPERETLLQAILDSALNLPGMDGGGLYERGDDGGYRLVLHRGLSPGFVAQVADLAPDSPQARLIRMGGLQCSCVEACPHCTDPQLVLQAPLPEEGILALVVLPILVDGEPLACLNLASKHETSTSARSIAALETLAHQFSSALERLAARERARRQQDNLAGLFDSIQDYVFVLEPEGRVIHVNRAVEVGLGYGARLVGRPVEELHPAELRAEARRIFDDLLASRLGHCPLPILRADGSRVVVDTVMTSGIWDGRPAIFGISRDISDLTHATETLQAREAELREATLFLKESQRIARVGGWKANPVANWVQWTEAVYELVEHPLDQPPPSLERALEYYTQEIRATVAENLKRAWEEGTPFSLETPVITRSGRRFWAELRCIGRVESAEGSFLTGTFQDIGERKRAEELQRFSAFQAGVAEMSVSVLHNIGNAITAVISDTNAVSRASEELARVAALLEGAAADFAGRLDERGLDTNQAARLLSIQRQAATTIERLYRQGLALRSQQINASVCHIADIVRLQQNAALPSTSVSAFDLRQALADALAMHADTLKQHGIDAMLEVDAGLDQVTLSRNRLLQALLNSIKNAYESIRERQSAEEGFTGNIRIRAEAAGPGWFRIRVTDNGMGIAPERRESLFRYGYSTKTRGSGFGLHATALFAQEMDGSIALDSPGPGHGATLELTLPISVHDGAAPEGGRP